MANADFLRRQAARELKAANSAVTDSARHHHLTLAAHYYLKAEHLRMAEEAKERRAAPSPK